MAVADPSSVAGRPGLIDQAQFINSKQEIVDACESLLNPEASQQQVVFNLKIFHVIFVTTSMMWSVQLKLAHQIYWMVCFTQFQVWAKRKSTIDLNKKSNYFLQSAWS